MTISHLEYFMSVECSHIMLIRMQVKEISLGITKVDAVHKKTNAIDVVNANTRPWTIC
jgi:hypothetical protein